MAAENKKKSKENKKTGGVRAISDEKVIEKTGKGWQAWFKILDDWDAPTKGHTASAKFLREEYDVPPWWAQAVTIRYEWQRGLKEDES